MGLILPPGAERVFHLFAQQGFELCDLFAHVVSGAAALDVEVELGDHHRGALVTAREDQVDASDRVDRFFDLARDLALHDGGRSAGVIHLHSDGGEVDVGELVDLEPLI